MVFKDCDYIFTFSKTPSVEASLILKMYNVKPLQKYLTGTHIEIERAMFLSNEGLEGRTFSFLSRTEPNVFEPRELK